MEQFVQQQKVVLLDINNFFLDLSNTLKTKFNISVEPGKNACNLNKKIKTAYSIMNDKQNLISGICIAFLFKYYCEKKSSGIGTQTARDFT